MDTLKHPAIVIIDPNEPSASDAMSLLSQMGLDAQVIAGSADALLIQARPRPDLVIVACRKMGAVFHAFLQALKLRQHGGDIAVESSLGQGSRFCVRRPRRPAPRASCKENVHGQDHSDRRGR